MSPSQRQFDVMHSSSLCQLFKWYIVKILVKQVSLSFLCIAFLLFHTQILQIYTSE